MARAYSCVAAAGLPAAPVPFLGICLRNSKEQISETIIEFCTRNDTVNCLFHLLCFFLPLHFFKANRGGSKRRRERTVEGIRGLIVAIIRDFIACRPLSPSLAPSADGADPSTPPCPPPTPPQHTAVSFLQPPAGFVTVFFGNSLQAPASRTFLA